jgi:RimJ/RimL family protein N-acetyltransferase
VKPDVPDAFKTERLTVRCPVLADVPEIHAAVLESLPELTPWMPWATPDYSLEACEENTRQVIADFVTRRDLRYHFHLQDGGALVASSGLHRINWEVPRFEIGYWVRRGYQGQGYVTEGVAGLLELAFARLGAARVEIRCDDKNARSAAVAERLGFQLEGVLRFEARGTDGSLRDTRVYSRVRP